MKVAVARLLVWVVFAVVVAFGADNSIGIWKFNAAKSKNTSTNPYKNRTLVREAGPDGGIKSSSTTQYMDGTSSTYSYTCKYDGKECPVTGGPFDTTILKRIDENSWSFEAKKTSGKYHVKGQTVISKDSKTLTQTFTGTDAAGKPVTATLVFDRQKQN
jgi:hypothetical protein